MKVREEGKTFFVGPSKLALLFGRNQNIYFVSFLDYSKESLKASKKEKKRRANDDD
jgi:hypothetical protein